MGNKKERISVELHKKLLKSQQNEINHYHIYSNMAKKVKDDNNRKILENIVEYEEKHYNMLSDYTGVEVKPKRLTVWFFSLITTIFGLTFGLKLIEKSNKKLHKLDDELTNELKDLRDFMEKEEKAEKDLLNMINEDYLKYVGSIVLGLNDALVELTGALAGFTFALQNTKIIALTGLIMGIAAALSLAASEYLSTKAEEGENALKSAMYTGITYIITVVLLILPYLIIPYYFICLVITLSTSVLIIFVFNYYISVAKDLDFKRRFLEMAGISLGVAGFSFLVGVFLRNVIKVDI